MVFAPADLDDERPAEPFCQPLPIRAREDVVRASGRKTDDDRSRPRWIGLRPKKSAMRPSAAASPDAEISDLRKSLLSALMPSLFLGANLSIRPVRIISGFAAGGANDILARLIGQWLTERLGRPFIVENRPGANTNIAAEAALNAAPDGHTLLVATVSNAVSATLYESSNSISSAI